MKKCVAFIFCFSLTTAFIKADTDDAHVQTSEYFATNSSENDSENQSKPVEIFPIDPLYQELKQLGERAINEDDNALLEMIELVIKNFDLAQTAHECTQNFSNACTEFKSKIELISRLNLSKKYNKKFLESLPKAQN